MKTNNVIFTCGMVIMAIIILLLATGCASSVNHYTKSAQVVEIDRVTDIVTVEDCNGELWEFEGVEDWQEGDWCAMIMSGHGTPTIYDDEIISTRYESWA